MEPVEIDIRMKQNVTEEGKKATGAMGEMDEAAKKMQEQVESMLEERKKLIADIEKNLSKTATNISNTSDTLSGDVSKLKKASDILGESLEDAKKQVADVESTLASGTAALDDYTNASEQLNQAGTELGDILAKSNELQDISNELMNLGKGNVEKLTRSKLFLAKANEWVAKTFKMSEAAAKRFTAVASFGLTIAISALISLYEKFKTKQEEELQLIKERLEVQAKLKKDIAEGYAAEVSKIEAARAALNSENVTREQKYGLIEKLKKQIPGYTAELDSEGRLIRENTAAYNDYLVSLEKSLLLRAAEKDLEKLLAQKYQLQKFEIEEEPKNTIGGKTVDIYKGNTPAWQINADKAAKGGIAEIDKAIEKVKGYISNNSLIDIPKPTIGPGGGSAPSSADKKEYDAQAALAEQLLEIRKRTAALTVDVMQDGLEKRLQQIDLEESEELARIKEHQQKILDEYNKSDAGKANPQTDVKNIPGIDPKTLEDIEAERTKITEAAAEKRRQATEANAKEITDLARKYADEEVKIRYDYQQDIDKLEKAGNTEAANAARMERDKRISEITAEMFESSSLYKLATDEKLLASKEATEALISDTKARIEALVVENKLTRAAADKMIADLDKTQVSRENSKNENNPFAKLIKGLNDYKKAKKELDDKRKSVTPGELVELEDAANSALKSTAGAAGMALQGVQSILGTAVDGLDQLGLLTEEEKETANQVIGMVGGAADLAMGIAAGNPVQIIQGSIDLIVNAIKLFDKKSRDIEKAQKKHLQNISDLERAYTRLQRSVEKALGTDVYAAQRAVIENNKKQIAEYEAWIVQEQKKKKKKQDQEAIKDARDKIQELKNNTEDELQAIVEGLAQTNAKSLAGELANALVSAARDGGDAFTAMGDVINDVLRNAVVNALSKKFLEEQMDEATKYLAGAMGDGDLSDYEKRRFEEMIRNAGTAFNTALSAYDELFANQDDASRRSAAKGIAQASQDSIDELSGTITFMAGEFRTANVLAAARTETGRDMLITTRTILSVLNVIAENTSYNKRLEDIAEGIEKLNRDGVNIKM